MSPVKPGINTGNNNNHSNNDNNRLTMEHHIKIFVWTSIYLTQTSI